MKRKKANISLTNLDQMMKDVEEKHEGYDVFKDTDFHKNIVHDSKDAARNKIFEKGLSKRIWDELYKVIDSSDVIIYVLDARNPNGTRTRSLEDYLRVKCPQKHLVFILNKCDLIPTSIT